MSCIVLTHLGPSIPSYMEDCCKQIRIWNPIECPVFLILELKHHLHAPFFLHLQKTYDIEIVYAESLKPTQDHKQFNKEAPEDSFRNGYWKYVKERFFVIEELIRSRELQHVISMEYDILVYGNLRQLLLHKLQTSHQTLRVVKDSPQRGHPGFMYIPNADILAHYNEFLVKIQHLGIDDMQALHAYGETFPTRLNFLPCITEQRNQTIQPRESITKQFKCENPWYLSQDSEHFQVLFDSAVVGQMVGGIDPRNTNGKKVSPYPNESALYTLIETQFGWARTQDKKWFPVMDNRRVLTIHIHSKALKPFLSDREDMPRDDYDVTEIMKTLERN